MRNGWALPPCSFDLAPDDRSFSPDSTVLDCAGVLSNNGNGSSCGRGSTFCAAYRLYDIRIRQAKIAGVIAWKCPNPEWGSLAHGFISTRS